MRVKVRQWMAVAGAAALLGVGAGAAVPAASSAGAAQRASRASAVSRSATSVLGLPLGASSGGPASLVNPVDGTGVGAENPGNVSEFPGATVPLGMVQFSPDTSPDRAVTTGSGYDYADSSISGFSLTHLSGDGCAIYGDIPILPVTGAVPTDPESAVQPFSHADEQGRAGNYSVRLGQGAADQRIGVDLTATTRSALGAFTFPALTSASGASTLGGGDDFLFKVSDSADGSTASTVRVVGRDALAGSVTSGDFCGIPGSYTVYFTAQFSQPFTGSGTWQNGAPGTNGSCVGTATVACGAWVSFGQAGAPSRTIMVKVGVSFVSSAGATANLRAEDPGWNFHQVSGAATAEWNGLLSRMAVTGGSPAERRTFYTALYHSLLFPSVFSDDDGRYVGFDHRIHTLAKGQLQFSNISECDEYKSEVPLLATLLPGPTSQMIQSLLRDADQTKGHYLPKWVIGADDAGEWDGDSADPIIADAYAYGARQFDLTEAVTLMIHGATVPGSGFIVERQNVAQYQAQGWVPQLTYDITSYPYTVGGSETLEYSVDDFSISQLAQAAGETKAAATFATRGQNWQNLFDPATGYLAARTADGSFPPGPAFQLASAAAQQQGIAQEGFEEGNAIQYTWSVSQNLAGLIGLMGGDQAAVAKLNTFFSQLNATRFGPYDWAGNEPAMSDPYDYDYAGDPAGTQSVVRRIMTQLYAAAPVNEPGEDDLGALSSWYVWSALGLYPETPGVAALAMTSPLFPKASVTEGNGHTLTIQASRTPDTFITHARLAIGSGRSTTWNKPWVPSSVLSRGATLTVGLGPAANRTWGTSASAAPPSFQKGAAPAVPFTTPGGALTMPAGSSSAFLLGVQEEGGVAAEVSWHVLNPRATTGVTVSSDSGTFKVVDGRSTTPLRVTATGPGVHPITFALTQGSRSLPSLTLDVDVAATTS
jgi:predicted alpha-1,2-mannosidase